MFTKKDCRLLNWRGFAIVVGNKGDIMDTEDWIGVGINIFAFWFGSKLAQNNMDRREAEFGQKLQQKEEVHQKQLQLYMHQHEINLLKEKIRELEKKD